MRMCTPHLESKFQSDKQNWFVYVFLYRVSNYISKFHFKFYRTKNIAMFRVYGQNFCSILYMDSYFFSLISEMGYVHVFAGSQVRRPVSYLQITNIFLFKFTSLSRLFHSYRDRPIGRWAENIVPQENHLTHPQAELGLSHI